MISVFLSSTAKDLLECRTLAYHAIEGLKGYHCIRMEDFGSWDTQPSDLCHRRVMECNLFVCLAGPLYGSRVPKGKSYTESEYDTAEQFQKPRLIFLTTDEFAVPAKFAQSFAAQRKQDRFRKRLEKNRVIATFTTGPELATKVVQAIRNWEALPEESSLIRVTMGPSDALISSEFRRPFLRLGRSPDSEVLVDSDPDVSWEHGIILKTGSQFCYKHLSQTNPTWIDTGNRQLVLKPGAAQLTPLEAHNEIRVGNTTVKIDIQFSVGPVKAISTNVQPGDE